MKKLLVAAIALIFVLTTVFAICIPAKASNPLSDNLIIWWNFDDPANTVGDSGSAFGSSTDLLMLREGATVTDGIAKIPRDDKAGLYYSVANRKDLTDYANTTMYMKFKLGEGTATTGNCCLLGCRSRSSTGVAIDVIQDSTAASFTLKCRFFGTQFVLDASSPTTSFNTDGWCYLAFTFGDVVGGQLPANVYLSGDGTNYVKTSKSLALASGVTTAIPSTEWMVFGKAATSTTNTGIDMFYDEIRVYNNALTDTEIAGLSATVVEPPVVTTTEPPVVTTPEPVVTTPEPVVTTPEPVVTTPEPPADTTPEPVVTTPEPPADTTTEEPSTPTGEPSTSEDTTTVPHTGDGNSSCGSVSIIGTLLAIIPTAAILFIKKRK